MLNLIKADIYRILRSKGFYITLAIFIITIVVSALAGVKGNIGINVDVNLEEEVTLQLERLKASQMPHFMLDSASNLLYLILPIVCIFICIDFSNGTIKNTLCYGITREKYFLSKVIMSVIVTIVFTIINILLPTLMGLIFNGVGTGFDFSNFIISYLFQTFLLISVTIFIVFLAVSLQKTAAVIGVYLGYLMIPAIILLILYTSFPDIKVLFDFEIATIVTVTGNVAKASNSQVIKGLLYCIVLLGGSIGCGLYIFKRSEIK